MNDGNGIAGASGTKRNPCHIVTFCRSIDDLLGGGIALGEVTEVAGLPGTGKTQLATQLSVLARLPHVYGGVEGRTLYVDAEGSFLAERAHSMANSLGQHVRGRAHGNGSSDFSTETILDSIDVFRVHDEAALLATLYSLRDYIESSASSRHSAVLSPSSPSLPVRLIVIDSIAFHFRAVVPTDSSYYVQRTKTLTALAAYLGELAHQHDLAVVVINQMTTKIANGNGGTASSVVPALGESWAHATATRLLLSKEDRSLMGRAATSDNHDSDCDDDDDDDDESDRLGRQARRRETRTCSLTKSAHRPTGTARYRVVEEGIRDVGENQRIRRGMSDAGNNKRSRTH
jgi:RAD51-like protein 2